MCVCVCVIFALNAVCFCARFAFTGNWTDGENVRVFAQLNWLKLKFLCLLENTGVITTKARIDYESIKQIYVNAYVTDTGVPQLTSTAEIIVDIVNVNDNEPVFSSTEYRFTVAENSPKGTIIGNINAKDGDDGKLCSNQQISTFSHQPNRLT